MESYYVIYIPKELTNAFLTFMFCSFWLCSISETGNYTYSHLIHHKMMTAETHT